MSTNKKSGKADQGSRLYLQEYMAHALDELSELYTWEKSRIISANWRRCHMCLTSRDLIATFKF